MTKFIVLFSKSLRRLSHAEEVIICPNPQRYIMPNKQTMPKYFSMHYPHKVSLNVDANNTKYIMFNENKYPINMNGLNNEVSYPHTKEAFYQHIIDNPGNKDLWYLNFLRDVFKADVALEHDFIYITHDLLAFIYYKFIGGTKGFLLSTHQYKESNRTIDYGVSF
jgi:hypothetical protein